MFGGAYLRREICVSKYRASIIGGRKFTIFALFYFVFEGNLQAPGRFIFGGAI